MAEKEYLSQYTALMDHIDEAMSNGYARIELYINGYSDSLFIHLLVATPEESKTFEFNMDTDTDTFIIKGDFEKYNKCIEHLDKLQARHIKLIKEGLNA